MTAPTASTPPTTSIIRPALALLAGLGITVLLAVVANLITVLAMLREAEDPRTLVPHVPGMAVLLASNGLAAFAGGFVAARLTRGRSFFTIFVLALVLFVSAIAAVFRGQDAAAAWPKWFAVAQAAIVFVAALLGGRLERRRQGPTRSRGT
ncbi:MAG: hypothetical protein HOQ19_05935 [Gemmatimonadaceae bacterium]|nr:hypothetical protein [Gemmatimonadaceae bacterium]